MTSCVRPTANDGTSASPPRFTTCSIFFRNACSDFNRSGCCRPAYVDSMNNVSQATGFAPHTRSVVNVWRSPVNSEVCAVHLEHRSARDVAGGMGGHLEVADVHVVPEIDRPESA